MVAYKVGFNGGLAGLNGGFVGLSGGFRDVRPEFAGGSVRPAPVAGSWLSAAGAGARGLGLRAL